MLPRYRNPANWRHGLPAGSPCVSPFDFGVLEVDQKAKPESRGTQIIQTLRGVLVGETFHALQFHDQDAVHEDVGEILADRARRTLRQPDPFADETKASDECLGPIFQNYFDKLGIGNLMQKTDYHTLVSFVPRERLSTEITEKLDVLAEVASLARPVR
jgi:hypothetical protein